MMLRLAFLSLLAVGSNAFIASPMNHVRTHQPVTARNLIMTEEEITTILDKAHGCVDTGCAVDDVDDLIAELKDQQKVLSERLETIMNVVSHLQHANTKEDRKTDDVRAIVKDMLRVFTTQVSFMMCFNLILSICRYHQQLTFISFHTHVVSQNGQFAIGFSGDIGDGPTTAYDALPPKPWKNVAP